LHPARFIAVRDQILLFPIAVSEAEFADLSSAIFFGRSLAPRRRPKTIALDIGRRCPCDGINNNQETRCTIFQGGFDAGA
jgi:hypothetical protein